MDNVICWLLLSHNPRTVKSFKLLYLNHALVSADRPLFWDRIVQVERLSKPQIGLLCSTQRSKSNEEKLDNFALLEAKLDA